MKKLGLLFSIIVLASARSRLGLFVARRAMRNQFNERQTSKVKWFSRGAVLLVYLALALPVMAGWAQRQKITSPSLLIPPPPLQGIDAHFGNAVAISGNTMVVGAQFDDTKAPNAGLAFVYVLKGTTWTYQFPLFADDFAAEDNFGSSVAISEDTIVVGAPHANASIGKAYVFVRNGMSWLQQKKFDGKANAKANANEEFGNAVGIEGETIVVGAHFAELPGNNSQAGSAYCFRRTGVIWTPTPTQVIIPNATITGTVTYGDYFGESIAMSGGKLAIGATGDDAPSHDAGAVYVYTGSTGLFVLQEKLYIQAGGNGDKFGCSVALQGNSLIGGAKFYDTGKTNAGAAYVFEFNGSTWSSPTRIVASDGEADDHFGWSVAVSNNVVAVGARDDSDPNLGLSGSVYVFRRNGATWTQQKLKSADVSSGDRFGTSVALNLDGYLAVGAELKKTPTFNEAGAAYIFADLNNRVLFRSINDFDGDLKAEFSFYSLHKFIGSSPNPGSNRKADLSSLADGSSQWSFKRSSDSAVIETTFGSEGDLMAPEDYDGDGKTDIAVFRPSTGEWFWLNSSDLTVHSVRFGTAGDLPMPADFDGDGQTDISLFRPSTGEWKRLNSSNNEVVTVMFGTIGDIPLIGDFDGDGKTDLTVFRNGVWNILRSSDGSSSSVPFGISSDIPVPADYDGDGLTDIAVFRPSEGVWSIQNSASGLVTTQFGATGDKPVPADYDGDGRADVAVFRPSDGTWRVNRSTEGLIIQQFGTADAQPVALFFVRQAMVNSFQFSASNYSVTEGPTAAVITVTRTGDSSSAISVAYATSDGPAKQTSDYTITLGTLSFASGETSRSFTVPITVDSFSESPETATLTLSNPTGGAVLGAPGTATLTIVDNPRDPATNPIDAPGNYVSQHYHDFLNRVPDPSGLAFWTNQITQCGSNQQCTEVQRINVSASFFLSIEFQETGYLVYRFYNAALNRPNGLPRYSEFLRDTQEVGRGVVVGATGWEAKLEANKAAYAAEFVERAEFTSLYPVSQTPAQFVDALCAHAGIVPNAAERQAAIDEFNNPTGARARVLRRVAENQTYSQREFNRAFVLMQYFGYLRRNPDDAPDINLDGYNFWLGKLNQFNGNFINAEMVKAFITSSEYRHHFGAN